MSHCEERADARRRASARLGRTASRQPSYRFIDRTPCSPAWAETAKLARASRLDTAAPTRHLALVLPGVLPGLAAAPATGTRPRVLTDAFDARRAQLRRPSDAADAGRGYLRRSLASALRTAGVFSLASPRRRSTARIAGDPDAAKDIGWLPLLHVPNAGAMNRAGWRDDQFTGVLDGDAGPGGGREDALCRQVAVEVVQRQLLLTWRTSSSGGAPRDVTREPMPGVDGVCRIERGPVGRRRTLMVGRRSSR